MYLSVEYFDTILSYLTLAACIVLLTIICSMLDSIDMIANNLYEVDGEDYLMPNSFVERKFIFTLSSFINSVDIVIRLLYPNIQANDERDVQHRMHLFYYIYL